MPESRLLLLLLDHERRQHAPLLRFLNCSQITNIFMRCRYFYLCAASALRGAAVGAEAELGVLHPLGGEVLALTPVVYYLDPRNGWRMQYI